MMHHGTTKAAYPILISGWFRGTDYFRRRRYEGAAARSPGKTGVTLPIEKEGRSDQARRPLPFPRTSPAHSPGPLPGPVPGTVLVPGNWQGNRWVPGRLERKGGRSTRWIPGYFTAEWTLGPRALGMKKGLLFLSLAAGFLVLGGPSDPPETIILPKTLHQGDRPWDKTFENPSLPGAGTPAARTTLRSQIQGFLKAVPEPILPAGDLVALIVPSCRLYLLRRGGGPCLYAAVEAAL